MWFKYIELKATKIKRPHKKMLPSKAKILEIESIAFTIVDLFDNFKKTKT